MHLTAYRLGHLQTARSLLVAGLSAGMSAGQIVAAIDAYIAVALQQTGVCVDTTPAVCPDCGGRTTVGAEGECRYQICVNTQGKAGCGWSRMV